MTFWVTFFLWAASFVITDYFRQRLPTVTPSGLGDFNVPTATEGRFVPLVWGTMLVEGPNVVWYGDFSYEELTVETGIIFKEDEVVGYKYFLGLQMGICRGQVAGIRRIWIGDDIVWDYTLDNGSSLGSVCDVSQPNLFGGEKQGGGFVGRFRLYDGTQTAVSPYLATQIASTILPSYKGYSYIVMTNQTEDGGAEIGESNSLRRLKFEIQTYDTVANGGLGDTLGLGNDHHFIGDDLNPVVMAFDIFTNTDWGRGLSPADLNLANFKTAAETVWSEGYGFSMIQDQVTTSKELLDLIEQHMDGYIGPNPETGLIEVNLARQDYSLTDSPASVFFADETNVISVSKFSRGENNQTFNEVRVQYLDRGKNYGDTYAPAQDLANLAIQGRRKSRINRMPGVHNATVASKIAWRDLRGATRALASATVEINREAWNLRPGDVIALTDDEVGVTFLPMRITAVRQGDPLNATIVLDVVEDVFGNEVAGWPEPPDTEFIPPSLTVLQLLATDAWFIDSPKRLVDEDGNVGTGNFGYPRVFGGIKRNVGGQATQFDLRVDAPKNAISPEFPSEGLFSATGMLYGVIASQSPELGGWAAGNGTFSIVVDPGGSPTVSGSLDTLIGSYTPGSYGSLGGLCVINPGGANEEWIVTDTIVTNGAGGLILQNVWRAALDSIMEPHTAGEEIWFIWSGGALISASNYAAGQNYEVKVLPKSNTESVGLYDSPLPVSQADSTFETPARASRPPPAVSLTLQNTEFNTIIDLDEVQTAFSPIFQGALGTTLQKPFNEAGDILLQVQGIKETGGAMSSADFSAENWTIEWWLFDLDATPSPTRGVDDILSSGGAVPITSQNNQIIIDKGAISPVPTSNSFNARIEFQVAFDPFNTGVPIIARDDLIWDFVINGTWVVPRSAVFLDLMTEGNGTSRYIMDRSDSAFSILPYHYDGDDLADAEPAWSPGFPGSQIMRFPAGTNKKQGFVVWDVLNPASGREFDWNQDWTVEFTIGFGNLGSIRHGIFGCDHTSQKNGPQGENPFPAYGLVGVHYDYTVGRFQFRYSSTVANETTELNLSAASLGLSTNTRYHVMITRKENADSTITFRTFINGVKTGGDQSYANFTVYDHYAGSSPLRQIHMHIGQYSQLYRDLGQSSGGFYQGYLDRFRIVLGYALEAIDYTPSNDEFDHGSSTVFKWGGNSFDASYRLTSEGGEIPVNVFGGTSDVTWDVTKFDGIPSIFCDGTNSVTPQNIGRPYWGGTGLNEFHDLNVNLQRRDFTFEAHVYFLSLPSTNAPQGMMIISKDADNFGYSWAFYVDGDHKLVWRGYPNASASFIEFSEDDPASPWPQSPIDGSISPSPIVTGRWYHFAACRNGDALSLFKDGVRVAYDDDFFSTTFGGATVGGDTADSRYPISVGGFYDANPAADARCLHGYISEPRVLLDAAQYDGPTYTVPTEPFGVLRGVAMPSRSDQWSDHCVFHARWNQGPSPIPIDEGPNGYTLTLGGTATINTSLQKYGTGCLELLQGSPVSAGTAGVTTGSGDGTLITTGTWAFDSWVRFNTLPAAGAFMCFAGVWNRNQELGWRVGYDGSNGWAFEYSTSSTTNERAITSGLPSPEPVTNRWYHVRVAIWRDSVVFFVDGEIVARGMMRYYNTAGSVNEDLRIGYSVFGVAAEDQFDGWIDEMVIWQDSVPNVGPDWDAEFQPGENFFPDIIFQHAVSHTTWPEKEAQHFMEFVDISKNQNTNISEGSSVLVGAWPDSLRPGGRDHFEWQYGTTSYKQYNSAGFTDSVLGDQVDFTIEMQFAWWSLGHGQECPISGYSGSNRTWFVRMDGGASVWGGPETDVLWFVWYNGNGANDFYGLGYQWIESPDRYVWHHIAYVQEAGQLRLYIDGTRREFQYFADGSRSPYVSQPSPAPTGFEYSTASSPWGIQNIGNSNITVGALQAGAEYADIYVDDARIVKGKALYTNDFTPPGPFGRLHTMPTLGRESPYDPFPSPQSPQGIASPQSPQGAPSPQSPQGASPQSPQGVAPSSFTGEGGSWEPDDA